MGASQFALYDKKCTGMVPVDIMTRRLVEVANCSDKEAEDIASALSFLSDDGGMVSYSAFLTACLCSHMASLSDSDLRGLFKSLDTDGDGQVKLEDVARALGDSISRPDLEAAMGRQQYLSFADVRWLLLGPRWTTLEFQS